MDPEKRWLDAVWPFVRASMPAPPGRVLEIGCGPLGGFVPALRADGYAATGVDPRAPEEPGYHRLAFEEHRPTEPVEAIVACRALHHAADLDVLLDAVRDALVPGGTVVVVEWARERFDEPTARWCFARLSPPPVDTEPGWLHRHRDRWLSSGRPWPEYLRSWAEEDGVHPAAAVVRGLDARFRRLLCGFEPYCFSGLAAVTSADEQAAIDAGEVQAIGVRYVGRAT